MNEIHITNFGPIKKAVINTNKRMQILIGTQASGKSTVCKVVYFCQKIRDYTLDFLMDANQFTDNHRSEYFNNYMKYLTRQFMGYFGKTTHIFNKLILMYFFKVWFSDLLKKSSMIILVYSQVTSAFLLMYCVLVLTL